MGGIRENSQSSQYQTGSGRVAAQDIEKIEVHWSSGSVHVQEGDAQDITFEETYMSTAAGLSAKDEMHYRVKDKKLTIYFRAPTRAGVELNKDLNLSIPKDMALKELSVNTASAEMIIEHIRSDAFSLNSASGAICLSAISGKELEISTASGAVQAAQLRFEEVEANGVSGAIVLSGDIQETDCASISGAIEIMPGENAKKVEAESVSGEISIRMPEHKGFRAEYASVSGLFSCAFEARVSKNQAIYGDESTAMELQTVSGAIQILKQ
ncbi:MAG: DUF4097 family beta strand repeat-containing protein [Christensenellales bacterium]